MKDFAFILVIQNIKNPNLIVSGGVKNKYKGAYKKIFDILNEDFVFVEFGSEDEELIGNDFYLYFNLTPDLEKLERILKLPNVEIISQRYPQGILVAPNGLPSNLNATQYEIVRTSAFKKWFGDWENDPDNASKVVDENGEPLVVYHGSDNKFNVFDIKKAVKGFHGLGFYFSDRDLEYGKYVYNCFLNLKKPFDINADYSLQEIKNILGNSYFEIKNLIQEELDYSYNGKIGGFVFYSFAGNDNLKKQGYDSLIQSEIYVAFEPNQIKLADGINTNFDSNSDDIRFEQGGELKAEDMLKHQLTIKRLKDLDDNDGYWVNHYHAKTKNYKPNTYYHLNTNRGLNAGVGKGLYLGRDKDALISFYDLEGENKTVDTYVGNPNWLDLMDYADYDRYEQEAIRKYGKNYVSKNSISDIDIRGEMLRKLAIEKGFDGIRYYDPQATGEEFVLFDVKKVKKIYDDVRFAKGGSFFNDKELLKKWKKGESIGFTAIAHLKSKGLIPRADGIKRKSEKYMEIGGEIDLEIISDRKGILDYLTRNSGRWYQRDFDELNELFNSNTYVEQDNEVVKDLSEQYINFYKKNPNFKKIPLIIYESNVFRNFGEGELFRYDFVNEVIISSSKKDYNEVKNFKKIPINDICGFIAEKYENKIYGALMHEYGHLVNISNAGYINDIWFNDNYEKIVKNISIYAGEKKSEFLAEVFALINIPNFDELDEEKKEFIIKNYYNLIPAEKLKYENGGTISQTPAPKKDQVKGSDINKKSSSKDLSSAKLIKFDEKTLVAIKNKVKEHNVEHPDKKINLSSAKAVVRRGFGAYSKSHRPTISGGKPNSRVAWGLARLNAFTYKIVNGKSKSGKYSQDDDLIEELGYKVANYENGGKMSKDIRCINCGWEWNRKDSELWDMYVCHKCGFDNTSFYTSDGINRLLKGGRLNSNTGVMPNYLKMFLDL